MKIHIFVLCFLLSLGAFAKHKGKTHLENLFMINDDDTFVVEFSSLEMKSFRDSFGSLLGGDAELKIHLRLNVHTRVYGDRRAANHNKKELLFIHHGLAPFTVKEINLGSLEAYDVLTESDFPVIRVSGSDLKKHVKKMKRKLLRSRLEPFKATLDIGLHEYMGMIENLPFVDAFSFDFFGNVGWTSIDITSMMKEGSRESKNFQVDDKKSNIKGSPAGINLKGRVYID